jgi:hypothetical protein
MTSPWVVTTSTERVNLDAQRHGELTFTVTNASDATDQVVFEPVAGEGVESSALTVDEPGRRVPGRGSASFLVHIAIPQQATAGRYELYGQAYSAHLAPEETLGRSGRVVFDVAAPPEPKRRPWWLLAVAALVVIVLAVVGWLVFGRRGTPTPAASPSQSPSASPTPRPQPTPICSTPLVLRGTFVLDADTCRLAGGLAGGDLFWEQFDSVRRALVPENGALIVKLGPVDFNALTRDQLATAPYANAPVDGSNTAANQLTPGTVLAVRTRTGHFAKIRIDGYGYDLNITMATFQ